MTRPKAKTSIHLVRAFWKHYNKSDDSTSTILVKLLQDVCNEELDGLLASDLERIRRGTIAKLLSMKIEGVKESE